MRFIRNPNLSGPAPSCIFGLGVHALGATAATIDEIMAEHRMYSAEFPDATCPDWSMLLHDLSVMLARGDISAVY